ncbi:XrtA/PEP-CTERM system TPR-repeat protein PrsT [Emcibacter sp. SYSU 3D8]|uniref:XrtA/PEP-CTERM system TPR-repeat protein PrsT n=1 Tax=Emcibacter sp. SYSU 3D8 TaxID=3133969 RepID=UPI0031FE5481
MSILGSALQIVRWGPVLIALSIHGTPAHAVPEDARRKPLLVEAQAHLDKNQPKEAVELLKNALKENPKDADARFLLGSMYLMAQQGPSAEKEFRAALAYGRNTDEVRNQIGEALLLQGKHAAVLKEINPQGVDPEQRSAAMALRGRAYLGLERFDEAQAAFEAATQLAPRSVTAKIGLARVLVQRKQNAKALALIDEALTLDPDFTGARILKGEMQRMAQQLEPALATFSTVLKANSRNVEARLGRAATLIDMNSDVDAQKDIDAALELAPKHPLGLYLNALILTKKQDYSNAQAVLQRAGAALDAYLPAQYLRGAIAYAQGNLEQAAANLNRFVTAVPDNANGRRLLGSTMIRQGRFDDAVKTLQPLADGPDADAASLSLVATARMGAGDYAMAIDLFQKASSLDPKNSLYRTQLAVARLAAGQNADAVKDLQTAVKEDPEATRPQLLLVRYHLFNRDYDAALKVIGDMLRADPKDPVALNLKGVAYRAKNNTAEARAAFQAAFAADPAYLPAVQNLARLDIQSEDYAAAEGRFRDILARDARNEAAMIELSRIALTRKKPGEAVKWLEKAQVDNPKSSAAGLRLIEVYLQAGDIVKALATASALDRRVPDRPEAVEALGRTQILAGDAVSAVATYTRLSGLTKDNANVHFALGRAQLQSGDALGARESYQQALKLDPKLVPAVLELVNLEINSEHFQAAMELATALRQGQPELPMGDLLVGHVMARTGKPDQAVEAFRIAEKKINSADSALRLYYGYTELKRPADAFRVLESWIATTPGDQQIRRVLASAYLSAGEMQKAIAHHRVLKTQDGDNPMILNNLAWLYQSVGDPRAVDEARRAYELAPKAAVVKDTYGWVLVSQGSVEQGVKLLEEAAALAPDEPEIQYHLALGRVKQGRKDEACALLETIMANDPDFRQSDDVRKLKDAQSCR